MIARKITEIIRKNPEKPYLIGSDSSIQTYGQLANLADSISEKIRLQEDGNKVIGLSVSDPFLIVPSILACWIQGRCAAILETAMTYEKFLDIKKVAGIAMIISDKDPEGGFKDEKLINLIRCGGDLPDRHHLGGNDETRHAGKMPAFLDSTSKIQLPIRIKINCGNADRVEIPMIDISLKDNDPALLLFTSGSTGVPKCVPLSLSNIASNIEDFSRILGISSEDIFLCTSPLWYAHGLYNSLLSALFLGATVVNNGVLNLMNTANAVRIANKHNASIYHLSPSMMQILLLFAKKLKEPFPKFKRIICGTAKLDPELKLKFENAFQAVVTQQYGMTETLFISVNARKQILCPESVGEPVSCEIRIFDDAMKALPEGSVGEIAVKSKSSFGEYFNQPDESGLSYCNGWFFTGDLGKMDSDGYLTVTGRKKELIKKGGVNISPHEINAVLSGFDGVSDAATVSVPDKVYGEEVCSFVSGTGLKEDKLHEHCRSILPRTHLPKKIFILDRLPKTSNGKTAIQELKKLAESGMK